MQWSAVWNRKHCVTELWAKQSVPLVQPRITHRPQGVHTQSLHYLAADNCISSRHTCEWMRLLWAGQAVLPVCRCWLLFTSSLPQFPCLGWLAITSMFGYLGDEFFSAYQCYVLLQKQSNSGARPEPRNHIFPFLLLRASHNNFVHGIFMATLLYWLGLKQI